MKKLSIFLLALLSSAGTMLASYTSVDGIWYNFDDGNLTAEVTYQGDKYISYSNRYSGEVVIPSSVTYNAQTYTVTSIGEHAFYKCSSLTSVTIPNSVTSIGDQAFNSCWGLTSVTIPNSVTSIGDYAFIGCSGLTSVTIPNSVTSIGDRAFNSCWGLTSLSVEEGNTVYDSRNNCNAIIMTSTNTLIFGCQNTTIPNTVTSIGENAFFECSGLTSVTIPNSVTSIGEDAFYWCTGLTSVTIPNSVTVIGGGAFWDVPNIVYSGEATGSPWGARSVNGYVDDYWVYSDNTKTTLLACSSAAQGEIIIPNSVTSIGSSAFYNCIYLTSVRIGNRVTVIGDGAFLNCTGLTSVEIPNSVTSIGGSAFSACTGLTSIEIPNSVTSIGDDAFYDCSGLTSVTNYATTPQSINSSVFGGYGSNPGVDKSTCVLNVPKESVSLYQAAEVWKDFTNIVGVDVPGEDPEEPIETIEGNYTIYYVDKESQDLSEEVVSLHVPVAPVIEGFTFIGWQTVSSMLSEGITLQAVYQADVPSSAPAVYTNPANPAQKLIRNGNVYILTDDKTYTITGQTVK